MLVLAAATALATSAPAEAKAEGGVRQAGLAEGALIFASEPGDYIGGGQTRSFSSPASTFTASFDGTTFTASISSPGSGWTVRLAAPAGQPLLPGTYENATRWPFNPPGQPGLDVSGDGRGCNTLTGRFTVARAEQTDESTIFEASFVQHCEGLGPALVGQIRIGPAGLDTLGPALALPGEQTVHADGPTPVSYTTAAVDLGDPAPTVACTPASGSLFPLGTTAVDCTATDTSGNQATRSFDVRVRARSRFVFASEPGDYIGGGQTRSFSSPASTFTASFDGTTFTASISPPGVVGWSVTLAAPAGQPLLPGTYEDATRWPFNPPGQPGLDVSGDGRGCNTLTGRFTVARAEQTDESTIFEASFVQHCEGLGPALVGQIRIGPAGADTLAPSLALPGDQTVHDDGPTPVSYTTAAVDLGDPAPTVACTPASGSLFPLGTTTVDCTATDTSDNQTTRSFTVGVRARTPLTLAVARRTISFGQSVRLTARLKPVPETDNPVVSIYARPVGGARTLVAQSAVGPLGTFSISVKPRRNTTYTAEWAGDETYPPSSSARSVGVHVVTTARLFGYYGGAGKYKLYRLGRLVKQVGRVAPNHAGRRLRFVAQEYARGSWRTVATAQFRIRKNGSAVGYFGGDRGTYRVRNVFARDADHLGDASPWLYFRIK